MKILFDQGTPVPLRDRLQGHQIDTVYELGWAQLRNGELLNSAEQAGYHVLVTTVQNLKYQQSLTGRTIAIAVLCSTSWPRIRLKVSENQNAIDSMTTGKYFEIVV